MIHVEISFIYSADRGDVLVTVRRGLELRQVRVPRESATMESLLKVAEELGR